MKPQILNLLKLIAIAFAAGSAHGAAYAQSAGDFVLSVGWMHFAPQGNTSNGLVSTEPPITSGPPGFRLSSANTVGLSGHYFLTDNFATTLSLGIAPRTNVEAKDVLAQHGTISKVSFIVPSIGMKYYFFQSDAKFRPFLGVGAAYLKFKDSTTDATVEKNKYIVSTIEHENRWSPVFRTGATYRFDEHWLAGLDIEYMPVRTTMTLKPPGKSFHTEMKINPIATYLNIGYRF